MGNTDPTQPEETQDVAQPEAPDVPVTPEAAPEEPAAEVKEGEEPATEGEEPPAATAAPEGEPEEKRRRAGGFQRQIKRLERQLEEKDALLSRVIGQQPAAAAQPGKEKTPEEKTAEYIDSLVEKRLAAREAQQQQSKAQSEFQRRTQEVRAAHPDFDEVVESAAHVPVSQAVHEAILTSEAGGEIMYQLAKSPAELARISALPPLAAAREIGRLEAKFASVTPAPAKTSPKSAARPPAPPTSVNGSTASTRNLDDLPLSDYKRAYRSGRR